MNDEEKIQKKVANNEVASGASHVPGQPASAPFQEITRQREQKIHEHLGVVLGSSDTLQACMGPVLCDILETCMVLKAALGETISIAASPAVGVKESMPLIQVYLQTVRQAERLANVDCRLRESRLRRSEEDTQ